jgi:hypothetical protein
MFVMIKFISSIASSTIEEAICKHWAVAGAMRGLVSLWELYAGSLFPNGYCFIPSLQNIRCCNFGTDPREQKLYYERVWNPHCCYASEECCQPAKLKDIFKSVANSNDNTSFYDVPNLSENPHPDYFVEKKENYKTVDVVIIALFGGAFVTVMVICGVTLYYTLRKRPPPQFIPLQPT